MKQFEIKTKVLFGQQALEFIKSLENKKVFIVTDPFIVESGLITTITDKLMSGAYQIFDRVVPDPPIELVVAGVEKVTDFDPDVMIAIGGGSAIDAAKAIMHFSKEIGNLKDMHFIAIPTTSGTGSEVTSFAVITDKQKGVKYPLVSDALLPDIAILEPELVKSVPPPVVADTGMDVLTHAIEAYVSTDATEFSDAFAEKAVRLVFEYLLRSYKNREDMEAKEKMHTASCLAGIAFNLASLGLNHAIAHNIGGKLHIAHGRTNAILLSTVIEYNADIQGYNVRTYSQAAKKYSQLATLIGLQGSNPRILVKGLMQKIIKLQQELSIPMKLSECRIKRDGKEIKITKQEIEEVSVAIAQGALEDACIVTNPRLTKEKDILEIIRKVM